MPPPFSNWKMSDTSGGLDAVPGLNVPLTSTGIGTSTPMAEPVPVMASSCCDKFIVCGATIDAASSVHTPATDGSSGDILDEHASSAPRTSTHGMRRTVDLHAIGIAPIHRVARTR